MVYRRAARMASPIGRRRKTMKEGAKTRRKGQSIKCTTKRGKEREERN
jgi:hypothetical protein